ncbi:MAG: TlyA family RNA methyltransferase [Acidimicrobiaceae bacterium]|nr:TlyA family RNA methyltransferase [Acidimicrobiaceae bacterium]
MRLDAELVRRGLVSSRTEAGRVIELHRVLVNGAVAEKPSRLVGAGDALLLTGEPPRFVSRGGDKLDAALDAFGLDVAGADALDAGASTGGFTDCLLQRGARRVVALDVGHGQLHPRIRDDARVVVIERFNVRALTAADLPAVPHVAVADLSFISLTKVIDVLASVVVPGGSLVLLVKPQFEAGRAEVSRGHGVITDPDIHARVRGEIDAALVAAGCTVDGWCDSPIAGGDGNREFLVHARTPEAALR